ncbi:MAG: Panacea domain-containing protein, partial [Bacteroidales bacterium]
MNFTYDRNKAKEAVLYIVSKLRYSDLHSVFKALYFAEKKHIAEYGRSITGDRFIAMNYGPVPSRIYDHCKESKASKEPFENAYIQDG